MGTRGLFGFYYKGKYYVVYNHFDSYPSSLGIEVIKQLMIADLSKWKEMLENIKVVSLENGPNPTEADVEALKKYTNLSVSSQDENDWYCLLRDCQGSMKEVLESGYLLNTVDENGDPLFEEYAYIWNFDTDMLDFYIESDLKSSSKFEDLKTLAVKFESDMEDETPICLNPVCGPLYPSLLLETNQHGIYSDYGIYSD